LSPLDYKYDDAITPLPEMITDLYTDSIMPTRTDISEILSTAEPSINTVKAHTKYPILDVLKRGGPGVYYHVICRAPANGPGDQGIHAYFELLDSWLLKHPENDRLVGANRFNIVKRINASMRRMRALKANALARPTKYGWSAKQIIEAPNQFARIRNEVTRTRSHSITQQNTRKRKTRKLRKRRN